MSCEGAETTVDALQQVRCAILRVASFCAVCGEDALGASVAGKRRERCWPEGWKWDGFRTGRIGLYVWTGGGAKDRRGNFKFEMGGLRGEEEAKEKAKAKSRRDACVTYGRVAMGDAVRQ